MSSSESFEDLLRQHDQAQPTVRRGEPKSGDRVRGTVVSIADDFVFVDLGSKTEGRMETAALRDAEGKPTVAVGDTMEATVTGKDADSGMLLLGTQHGHKIRGLEEIRQAHAQGMPVPGQITAAVKGGLEVQVSGLRAFCPASQVDIRFVEDLTELVGQKLDFRVTKIEGGRRPNLVLSRRAILEEEQKARAEQLRAQLTEGAVLSGTVSSIKDYGAFVDLGGIEGMIHISELAFGHIKHPGELLTVGQPVEVAVLRIEPGQTGTSGGKPRDKIALSIRALSRDPWADAAEAFPVGTRVTGKVSRLQPFGAFVELAPGVDGLAHISELGAQRRVNHPSEVLSVGDTVEARVLSVDLERRRIGLTLDESKQVEGVTDAANYASLSRPPRAAGGRDVDKHSGRAGTPNSNESAEPAIGSFGALLRESMDKKR